MQLWRNDIDNSVEFQKLYLDQKLKESNEFLRLFFIYAPMLYLSFSIVDFLVFRQLFIKFLIIRIVFTVVCSIGYFFLKNNNTYLKNQNWQLLFTIVGSLGINLMLYLGGGPGSEYYSGLNLVAIVALMFATFENKHFYASLMSIYLPYILLCYFQYGSFNGLGHFTMNMFFSLGALFTIVFTRSKRNENFIKLLHAQLSLKDEIKSREEVIRQKTDEATRLNQLSAQFSPQVVKAIKEGQIELDEQKLKRERICAVFIDIVRSTERVISLPETNIQLTLAKFLDTVLSTFLKYDLTIDKFQGDGVLAFSNSPVKRPDFIERTCLAALEAKQALENDTAFYLENWGSEMQVRIGISVGYANVGFYGDKKYFKTFTAIGAPLPLASRLTSIAEPQQILIDREIAETIQNQSFELKNLGEKHLKGFEKESHIVYELLNSYQELYNTEYSKTCPDHPNSVLYLDTNDKGHFIFKCRECGYQEVPQQTDSLVKAKAS